MARLTLSSRCKMPAQNVLRTERCDSMPALAQFFQIFCAFILAIFFIGCVIEDPPLSAFDLQKIKFGGRAPVDAEFTTQSPHIKAKEQAVLKYEMDNGDTMEISVFEFENSVESKAFFYSTDSITEKRELLLSGERKRFFGWGRRLFSFSYNFSISEKSSLRDSIDAFFKRFPAADTGSIQEFQSFNLENSGADSDFSVQRDYFFGIPVTFDMLVRTYRDEQFSWVCARSSVPVSETEWEKYYAALKKNALPQDRFALVNRLSNGIVVAVYGNLDNAEMAEKYKDFVKRIK